MRLKQFLILFLASCLTFIPLLSGCIDSDDDVETETVSGKVAQEYVDNATVFWDKNSNLKLDANERSVKTEENGDFTIKVPKHNVGGQLIAVNNGTVGDSKKQSLTMTAPKDADNITSVTTMATFIPDLKDKIGENWDADIASDEGVEGKVLQLALSAETLQYALDGLNLNSSAQLSMMSEFGENLKDKDLKNTYHIVNAVNSTLNDQFSGATQKVLRDNVIDRVRNVCNNVRVENPNVKESNILDKVGRDNQVALNFNPTKSILPFPNDFAWYNKPPKGSVKAWYNATKFSGGNFAKKVFYTAVNQLENNGTSPNTPIAIPLTNGEALNSTELKKNVLVLNLDNIREKKDPFDVSPYEVMQDDNFIKIYPTQPLDPNTQYLVVIKDDITLQDTDSKFLGANTLLKLLQSTDEITQGDLKALEPLREEHDKIYNQIMPALNQNPSLSLSLSRDNVLSIFTFTTAKETLSLADFGQIQNATTQYQNGNIQDYENYLSENINGIAYDSLSAEYGNINSAFGTLPKNKTDPGIEALASVNSSTKTFTSFDVTTLTKENKKEEKVDYSYLDKEKFDGSSVIVYQHGLWSNKTAAQNFIKNDVSNNNDLDHPVIAMDLPKHGERSDGEEFFSTSLTDNRINMYQSFFDISMFIKNLKMGNFDLNDNGEPGQVPEDVPANIYFVGQSLGSITGSVAVDNLLDRMELDKANLTVGGANMAALLDAAKAPQLETLVEEFGVKKNTTPYFLTLGLMQMIQDPADPTYLIKNNRVGGNILLQNAKGDTWVPNISNQILAESYGFGFQNNFQQIEDPTTRPGTIVGKWFMLGTESNWIPHGIMLNTDIDYPAAQDHLDQTYVDNMHDTSRYLLGEFLTPASLKPTRLD